MGSGPNKSYSAPFFIRHGVDYNDVMQRFSILLLLLCSFEVRASQWVELTRRIGRSDADHRQAVAALKQIKGLEGELIRALSGNDKYLALEVISELKLTSTLPRLLELAPTDENGAIYLTLSSLIDSTNAQSLERLFHGQLLKATAEGRSDVVKVILLDTLARFQASLDVNLLHTLFSSSSPEVRHAVLYYLYLQQRRRPELVKRFVELGEQDPTELVRSRALALKGALP